MSISELLPIGSVIWLKGAEHALMIFGVKQTNNDTDEDYDYIGVPYPEGNMGTETQFLFMHEDIDKISFIGFSDESRDNFINLLKQHYGEQ